MIKYLLYEVVSSMLLMKDILDEKDKRLRKKNTDVTFPLSKEEKKLDPKRSESAKKAAETRKKNALEKNQQIMLFLNRRGHTGFISCRSCGHVMKCPHCDVSLTLHKDGTMRCHYCGYEKMSETLYDFQFDFLAPQNKVKNIFPIKNPQV